jgi:hypothetical protein
VADRDRLRQADRVGRAAALAPEPDYAGGPLRPTPFCLTAYPFSGSVIAIAKGQRRASRLSAHVDYFQVAEDPGVERYRSTLRDSVEGSIRWKCASIADSIGR